MPAIVKIIVLDMQGLSEEDKRAYKRKLALAEIHLTEKEYLEDLETVFRVLPGLPWPCCCA